MGKKKEEAPGIGHNSSGEVSSERLKSFVKRIEKLNDDRAAVTEDIRDVYAEAKSTGFEVKIIRQIIRERKIEAEKRRTLGGTNRNQRRDEMNKREKAQAARKAAMPEVKKLVRKYGSPGGYSLPWGHVKARPDLI